MFELLVVILATVIGCIGFRVRGGLWNDKVRWGSTTARFVAWSTPMAVITMLGLGTNTPLWYIPIFILSWWLGTILGWWKSIDMGRMEGSWIQDFILQSLRGVLWVLPTVIAMAVLLQSFPLSLIILLVGGLSCGVCYEIGWRMATDKVGGTEWGEYIFGAVLGLTTALATILIQ